MACGSEAQGTGFTGGMIEPTDSGLSMVPETSFLRLEGSTEAAADASAGNQGGSAGASPVGVDASKLPGDECPAVPPAMASACTQMVTCTYDACDTTGTTTAHCDGQQWTRTTQPCAPFPCPADLAHKMCNPGEICKVIRSGSLTAWSCDKSACGTGPINCRCGAYGGFSTCAGACVGYEGHQVNCAGN